MAHKAQQKVGYDFVCACVCVCVIPLPPPRLPGNKGILLSTDSGELEVWTCCPPGCSLENHFTMGSHDDMALCVGCLFGGDKAVSGGADRRLACDCTWSDITLVT